MRRIIGITYGICFTLYGIYNIKRTNLKFERTNNNSILSYVFLRLSPIGALICGSILIILGILDYFIEVY